jgi:hypothetical protein
MPIISPFKRLLPLGGKGGASWSSYWATLISATVENAAPTHVVLTFPVVRTSLGATDFSITIDGYASAISDATWVGAVLTLSIADTVIYGDTVVITFQKTGETTTATNNTLADYYVRTDGSNTSPYDTPAKGATAINTVMTYINDNGDGSGAVVSIGAGTFSGANIYFQSANQDNVKVVGASAETTIVEVANRVIYQTLADNVSVKRITARTLSVDQEVLYGSNESKLITFKNMVVEAPLNYNDYMIRSMGNHFNISSVIIKGTGVAKAQVYAQGGSNMSFDRVISVANGSARYNDLGWTFANTGTINIDHCNVLDAYGNGLSFTGAGTFNVKNSIISGNAVYNSSYYSIYRTAGTLTLSNNLLFSDLYHTETFVSGDYVDGGGNVFINSNPKFKNYARKGYILPRVDDNGNTAYAANLGTLLAAKGFSGSFYIYANNLTALMLPYLKSMVSSGNMEVGCHSYSHTDVAVTGKIWDITKGAETVTIDRTADTITLSGGGMVSGFKAKTLAAIKLELEGLGATVTASAIYGGGGDDYVTTLALGESLDDGAAVNQADLLIDNTAATGYLKVEMVDSKALITAFVNSEGNVIDPHTTVAYECRTWEAPYGSTSVDARLALIAAGYEAACSADVLSKGYIVSITDFDLFAIPGIGVGWISTKTEEVVRANARLLAFMAAQTGKVVLNVSHGEVTDEEWGWALDEWYSFGDDIKVCSVQKFADDIKGGDWTDNLDGTYSRIYVDDADYELEPASELIGAADDGGNIGAK